MSEKKIERRGLGRGLSALMADVHLGASEPEQMPRRAESLIPIEKIHANPDQPRRAFAPEALDQINAGLDGLKARSGASTLTMQAARLIYRTPHTLSGKIRQTLRALQLETHYDQFIAELTVLTRKYGVAIQSVGGVILADAPGEFRNVTYRADISSGDLYPEFADN